MREEIRKSPYHEDDPTGGAVVYALAALALGVALLVGIIIAIVVVGHIAAH